MLAENLSRTDGCPLRQKRHFTPFTKWNICKTPLPRQIRHGEHQLPANLLSLLLQAKERKHLKRKLTLSPILRTISENSINASDAGALAFRP